MHLHVKESRHDGYLISTSATNSYPSRRRDLSSCLSAYNNIIRSFPLQKRHVMINHSIVYVISTMAHIITGLRQRQQGVRRKGTTCSHVNSFMIYSLLSCYDFLHSYITAHQQLKKPSTQQPCCCRPVCASRHDEHWNHAALLVNQKMSATLANKSRSLVFATRTTLTMKKKVWISDATSYCSSNPVSNLWFYHRCCSWERAAQAKRLCDLSFSATTLHATHVVQALQVRFLSDIIEQRT